MSSYRFVVLGLLLASTTAHAEDVPPPVRDDDTALVPADDTPSGDAPPTVPPEPSQATHAPEQPAPAPLEPPSGATPQQPASIPDRPITPRSAAREKSPAIALALSLSTTALGAGFVVGTRDYDDPLFKLGLVIFALGPTTGHAYAGNLGNMGMVWRVGSAAVAGGGFGLWFAAYLVDSKPIFDAGTAVMIGGGVSFGLGTVYEIATAPMSARAFNRKHARQLAVTPVIGREPGLAIGGTF